MATAAKRYQVDITTNPSVIIVTAEPVASNVPTLIPISEIISVTPIFYDYATVAAAEGEIGLEFKTTYPYATMTRVVIEFSNDNKKLDIECQSVTNQATWSTGLKSGLLAAVNAIQAIL